MINLSCYTDNENLIILFYENTKQKYRKTLAFSYNEFTISKHCNFDFSYEKMGYTEINTYELFFNEKYKYIIDKMLSSFENLINDNVEPFFKPHFWRGKLDNRNKAITYETGIKYTKQIIKEFYKKYKELLNELDLKKEVIKILKSL